MNCIQNPFLHCSFPLRGIIRISTGLSLFLLLALLSPQAARAQGALTNGFSHTGTIAPAGDSDTWTFSATAGDSIIIRVGEITQTNSFVPRIRLQNPSAVQIASDFSAVSAEIVVTSTNSGTFTVIVDDNVGTLATGTYRLTLAKSPGAIFVAPGDEGGPLTNGVTYEGNSLPPGDLDVWTFSANSGESIVLKIGQMSETNNFDPWVRIYGPNGVLQGSNAGLTAGEVTFRATNSGAFTVVVANDPYYSDAASGTYRITLAKTGSPIVVAPGDEGGPMTNGVAHQGNLPTGDLDLWSFSANAGDSIVLKLGEITAVGNLDLWIRLYGPDGALLGSQADVSAAEVALRATNSGTFLAVVGNNPYYTDAASGTYRLTLAKTGSPIVVLSGEDGGPMTNGVAHQGSLPVGGLDLWTFTANAGESIIVKAGQISEVLAFDPWIRLYGPDGTLLVSKAGTYAPEATLRATNSGTFLVVIGNDPYYNSGASGTYLLTLAKTGDPIVVSPGDEGGPLTNGVAHQGSLPIGDLDLWSFTATAGQSIIVRAGQVSETGAFDPWVRVYGPDGALLGSDAAVAYGEVTFRATNSGTFLVVVSNDPYYNEGASGTYVLTLAKTGDAIVVAPGDDGGSMNGAGPYLGNLPVGDIDLWTFTACIGDILDLRVDEITQTNSFDPWIRLYDPSGALLVSSFAAATVEVTITATNRGKFLVVIANNDYNNNAGSGTYQLLANGLADGLKLCLPRIAGTNAGLSGIGGTPNAGFVLFTHTNVSTPLASWTPITTNQFDSTGYFTYTNLFNATEKQRYFRARSP